MRKVSFISYGLYETEIHHFFVYFRSDSSVPDSPSSLNVANDGFSQLIALVQRGERKGLFTNKMPASIQRIVRYIFKKNIYLNPAYLHK